MMKPESSSAALAAANEARFKGVRRRKWGRWVSEIRLPNSRERIWLGSYDSPEKAARAFDAAAVCLRGRRVRLNFPSVPPRLPPCEPRDLTPQQIQAAAARHANDPPPPAEDPAAAAATAVAESPVMSPSEVSDAMTAESEELLDWSFMDLLTVPEKQAGFPTADELAYGFFSPVTVAPPEWPQEENASPNSCLWNF